MPGRKQTGPEKVDREYSEFKGYIGEIAEDYLTLVDARHGTITPIPYSKIEQVKSNQPSPFFPLALGAAVIGGVMIVVALSLRGS